MQGPIYRLSLSPQEPEVLRRRLHKALKSHAQSLFISYREFHGGFDSVAAQILAVYPWSFIIAVDPDEVDEALLSKAQKEGHWLVLQGSSCNRDILVAIEKVRASGVSYALLLRPQNLNLCRKSLQKLQKEDFHQTFFEFRPFDPRDFNSQTVNEIADFLKKLGREIPSFKVRPFPGLEFFHPGIPSDFELEANEDSITSVFEFQKPNSSILMSIIIPAYNAKLFLSNALRHLLLQSLPSESFEVIIVDDGSDDDSANYISSLFFHCQTTNNLKYLYWPRAKKRARGDSFFRAGLARNLGVRHAQGSLLTFMDADMIVDENFLQRKIGLLKEHELVQSVRYHLQAEHSSAQAKYAEVNLEEQTYIEDKSYWGPFFSTANWQALPFFWKYTCTYCLSLKKSDFYEQGRFYRNFVSYGFEDTHVGYRFAKSGKSFFLDKVPALHLTSYSQSEYQSSKILRMMLLDKTAKILFLNTLDLDLYEHFRSLLGGEKSLFFRLKKCVSQIPGINGAALTPLLAQIFRWSAAASESETVSVRFSEGPFESRNGP